MEKLTILFENEKIKIEEIESFGEVSPQNFWYDQQDGELVKILCGEGHLQIKDGSIIKLKKGEVFYINSHLRHRVIYTSNDCKWLCVYLKDS